MLLHIIGMGINSIYINNIKLIKLNTIALMYITL